MRNLSLACARKCLYEIRSSQLASHATRRDLRFPNAPTPGPAYSTTSLQWQHHDQSQLPQKSVSPIISTWSIYPPAKFQSSNTFSPLTPPAASTTLQQWAEEPEDLSEGEDSNLLQLPRPPRSLSAIYLKPLKRTAKYGLPACDLQLRSYSVRNLEFFVDFALRAAYYLYLPAAGPVPLPRITERWTVPRSNFVNKSSQENFERITLRRLIQIQDGNPETVEIWLAFLRKHAYYGIGMKANVWGYEKLGVGKTMDDSLENTKQVLERKWAHFGRRRNLETSEKVYEMMSKENFRHTSDGPMTENFKKI
ncbi:mitochondrial 37S ribosomal protein rsm10 [Lobaria immixta]|nr:mitochondrial 37S ribosomal protein rsm10 [Lobaria immixta]